MTVVLATIAVIFLMMPGFAFVAGVNISDKNVREIVFRGTPAEFAYVVAISLIVHLAFSTIPLQTKISIANRQISLDAVNPAKITDDFTSLVHAAPASADSSNNNAPIGNLHVFDIVQAALFYFVVSGLLGGFLGLLLGLAVRRWKLKYFIKHRWMTMLIGLSEEKNTVYAYAILTPAFSQGKESITQSGSEKTTKDAGDGATVIRGWVRDSYFDFNGTLLYLVFGSFQDAKVNLAESRWLDSLADGNTPAAGSTQRSEGRLVLEGRNVAFVQYEPVPLRVSASEILAEMSAEEIAGH
jgi:hypothetical protein